MTAFDPKRSFEPVQFDGHQSGRGSYGYRVSLL